LSITPSPADALVRLDQTGAVATVTLNRPDSLNALIPPMMKQLLEVLRQVAEDPDIGCVILTGEGRGFCPGGDLRAADAAAEARAETGIAAAPAKPARQSFEGRVAWVRRSVEAARLLHLMPKPTIALVNGACAGAGLSLAGACDLRIASDSAVFRSAFLSGGLSGDYGGSWFWTRILGTARARELYLLSEKMTAQEALAFGLVSKVAPAAELRGYGEALAARLAQFPEAAAYAKENLNLAETCDLVTLLDQESRNMLLSRDALMRRRKTEASG
jgi:2-(1,2-epoxy-1,2-dihydrophenyl)acetyl-CoA isomerase